MPVTVRLFGEPAFYWQTEKLSPRSKKTRAMLIYLALQDKPVNREALAELLWKPGRLNSVRQALYELRQLDGADDWLHDNAESVWIEADCDARAFEIHLSEGRYQEAAELCQAPLLEGYSLNTAVFESWLELERLRYSQLSQEAREGCLADLERSGNFATALPLAKAALAADPLNETNHRTLMRLHYRLGNLAEALSAFEQCRVVLRDELGVEPLPETLALLADIEQSGSSSVRMARLLKTPADIPNRADVLLGRDAQLKEALETLQAEGRLLIYGFGGTGKSSLAAELVADWLADHEAPVLWLEVGSDTPSNAQDALARVLNAETQLAQATDKSSALKMLLSEAELSLLVLDDVRSAYTFGKLRESLPDTTLTLFTSRNRYPKLSRLHLDRLERSASLSLLRHYAKRDLADETAQTLCDLLADHAYGLRLAGITLADETLEPDVFIEQVRSQPFDLKLPSELASSERESLASLLNLSLEPLSDPSYDAFITFGALPTPSATPELVARLSRRTTEETEEALFDLSTRGLAVRNAHAGSDTVSYRLHDLAHAYAQANSPLRRKTFIAATLGYLAENKTRVEALETEISNILSGAQAANQTDLVRYMRLLTVDGTYYSARGHSTRSIGLLERAIEAAKEVRDLEATHCLVGKLGDVHSRFTRNYDKALLAYQEALEFARKDKNIGREAVFLSLIGIVYSFLSDDKSSEYMQDAYNLAVKSEDALALCTVLEQRGYIYALKEDWANAESLFLESLELLESFPNNKIISISEINRRRFFTLLNLGESQFALNFFEKSLDTRLQALRIGLNNDNEIWQAHAYLELAEVYHSLKQVTHSLENYKQALRLYQNNDAFTHVSRVISSALDKGYEVRQFA